MRRFLLILVLCALPSLALAGTGNLVKEATLRKVISDFLAKKNEGISAEVTVKKIGISGDLQLPPGEVSYEVIAPERWEGWGSASLALVVRVNDVVKRNLTVLVDVEALADMVVAARTLERGEVLGPSDLIMAKRDLAHVQGRFCRSVEDVVGLRVKSAVRANTPLRSDYLERVPVVKSGQMVTMVAENSAVRITASGRAKGAGAVGDMIVVQNLSSQKDVPARVVDSTTVKVDF